MTVDENVFMEAVKSGDLPAVESLLEQGVDVNARTERGNTGLIIAARAGNLPLIYLLLARGAEINERNHLGQSALLIALTKWTLAEKDTAIVAALLEAGADVNVQDNGGFTPLHWAATRGTPLIVQRLLNAGADVNAADERGVTALLSAAMHGLDQIIAILLKGGADPNMAENIGHTPLAMAVAMKHTGSVKLLLDAGAKIRVTEQSLPVTLMAFDKPEIMSLIKAATGTDLHDAAKAGDLSTVINLCGTGRTLTPRMTTGGRP